MSARIDAVLIGVSDVARCVALHGPLGGERAQGAGSVVVPSEPQPPLPRPDGAT